MTGRRQPGPEARRRIDETERRDIRAKVLNPIERATVMGKDLARVAAACERTAAAFEQLVALVGAAKPNSPGTVPADQPDRRTTARQPGPVDAGPSPQPPADAGGPKTP